MPFGGGQALAGATFGFPEDAPDPPSTKKVKEWSPIDRMLAQKRGSKSASPKPPRMQGTPPGDNLPPLSQAAPAPARTASAQVQTKSWDSLLTEALAPERQRCTALQAELKSLRAQLKEKERAWEVNSSTQAQELEKQWTSERADLEAQLAALRDGQEAVRAEHEAERQRWQTTEHELRTLLENAKDAGKTGREDVGVLREQLTKSQQDVKDLHRQIAKLREENAAMATERDMLMQRLEDEQQEQMARVDALEQRFLEKAAQKA